MNKQRRIIRRMCAAGAVGILAVNIAITDSGINYTNELKAEKYHTSAKNDNGSEIRQVIVPVKPTASNSELLNTKDASNNANEPNNLDGSSKPNQSENKNETGTPNIPNQSEKPEGTDIPNQSKKPEGTDIPNQSEKPEETDIPNQSGDEEETENPNIPDQSEKPEGTDTPNQSEKPDGTDMPNQPGDEEETENPNTPDETKKPEETDNSSNTQQPNVPNQSEDSNSAGSSNDSNQTGKPDNSKEPTATEKPDSPNVSGNSNNNGLNKPFWSLDVNHGFNTNISDEIIDTNQFQPEKISPEKIKNASLIMNQKLVKLPNEVEDYRFWTVARKYAFAKENLMIRESIVSEENSDDRVRAVGKLRKNGLLYILKEEDNGWLYVESGRVRGFVRLEEVITNEEANRQLEIYQKKAKEKAERLKQEYTGIEETVPMARELLPWQENEAFTYLRATVNQTVVEKKYALAKTEDVEVKEEKDEQSRVVGVIPKEGLCYILEDEGEEWSYIESGDVRGFVKRDSLQCSEEVKKQVEEKNEDTFSMAKEKIKPEENKACYYTLTSIKSGVPSGEIRRSIVEFAAQFVGNPYVWGGTSLTKGADCSGFVQSIYKQYGYDLPRVSRDQAQYGTKIPVEDALPGDLIFYANNGNIYHVVMYAGEGKTIEAMSTDMGIVQANVSKESAVWATRVLKDDGYGYEDGGISKVNATQDMYGKNLGNFKLTYYCACELCCDIETGITATGAPVVEGRTIAVDPRVIPYGTQVIIGGHIFTAEDCGGAIKENRIDIYVNEHEKALELGVNYADVYLKK